MQQHTVVFVVERLGESPLGWSSFWICRTRLEEPLRSAVLLRLVDEFDVGRRWIKRRVHEFDPVIHLARHLLACRLSGFAPIVRFQPGLSMFARKRSLIAANPFRSAIRISIVCERDRQRRNRNEMNTG